MHTAARPQGGKRAISGYGYGICGTTAALTDHFGRNSVTTSEAAAAQHGQAQVLPAVEQQEVHRAVHFGEGVTGVAFEDGDQVVQTGLGDLAGDLRAHLHQLARFLTLSDAGAVFTALLGHAQHDPAFATVLRARYLDEQRRRDRLPLERAVQRGELPAHLDTVAEVDQLVGPVYHRVLVTGDPVDRAFTDLLVDNFLRRQLLR
ncbi:TetR-like C-terminal domain-containing protein [Streptomyces sp. NPDC057287]|uniref:TetR-like C-terminal domain-containing protein n=1 Tax=Streptomyces sp. NPDC057287 TaxID=3346086 RepID=UPI0036337ED8